MMNVHLVDANGELQRSISAIDQATIDFNTRAGELAVSVSPPAEPAWWDGTSWVLKPEQPDVYHEWSAVAHAWMAHGDALANAQAAQREMLLQARASAERTSTFECDGHVFNSNKVNVGGATSGALMAMLLGQPFSQTWTLADNSMVDLDGPAMMRVGAAQLLLTGSIYQTYRVLADQVEAATTVADVLRVTWPI